MPQAPITRAERMAAVNESRRARCFFLRVIYYLPGGGEEVEDRPFGNVSLENACHTANRLQAELDADGDVAAVYVLDPFNVPIARAAGAP
ncbi:MAG: hypothetical protein ACREUL_18575 [Steroidobacteraceae bacterium]